MEQTALFILPLESHISLPLAPSLIDRLQFWLSFHRIMASKEEGLSIGAYRQHLINFRHTDVERNSMIDVSEHFLAARSTITS